MMHSRKALLAKSVMASATFLLAACSDSATEAKPATEVLAQATTQVATQAATTTGETIQVLDTPVQGPAVFDAPDGDWRMPDPESTLYIDTNYGRMIVELYPEIAPIHVERVRSLASNGFYDGLKFHRVIDGFMNQTGDPTGTGSGDSGLPDLQPEFNFRRGTDMPVAMLGAKAVGEQGKAMVTGFYKALPIATQPSSQAILTKDGKVEAHGLHCAGVLSAARTSDPATANSQFFLMRDYGPWLDNQYSIWGKVVSGHHILTKIKLTEVDGVPNNIEPDVMTKVTLASTLDEGARVPVQVLDTNSDSFQTFLETQKVGGEFPDICDVDIPVKLN